ncbi:S8 family serine peptidase [Streptomyces sp. Q6]|uniref:S8 family serine peptidase n=1 Tax=Streptomyces citrinus TaxID=3118173 RepID=A0ACD5A6H6_9ACTN
MRHVPGRGRPTLAIAVTVLALLAGAAPSATAAPAAPAAPNASAASARDVLASLDDQELRALHRTASLNLGGLHVTDRKALKSAQPVDVIVQLDTPPARTARLLAATRGHSLSADAAEAAVGTAQKRFRGRLHAMMGAQDATVRRAYTHSFDGVNVRLPGNRVADLLDQDGVTAVWPDTEVKATATTEAPSTPATEKENADAQGLARLHDEGLTGKGVKVGIIDTGIDYRHPDLKAAYAGGHDFVDDDDDPMETTYADWKASGKAETNYGSPYYTEHGTHVAGIVAGRGDSGTERAAHGVAPGASVYAYRALGPYGMGYTSDILAAMDRAAKDGMDVVNMSLGATLNDPLTPQAVAADNLVLAGITTVIAAGNSGPDAKTLGTPGAAALPLTVGAHDAPLTLPSYTLTAGGSGVEGRLLAQPYGDGLDQLTDGAGLDVVDVATGTAAGYTGKDVTGKAVRIVRGAVPLDEKVRRAKTKGAAAVLLVNDDADEGHIPYYLGESAAYVPTFSVSAADGPALTGHVTFTTAGTFRLGGEGLADFSSRGPVYGTGAIKPEITAPGVSILSSVPADTVTPGSDDYTYAYARLSGTSMATPYVAGVAALMLQDDPDRTPDDIKTALMNTARPLPGDVSVFEAGAGAVDAYDAVHTTTALTVPATTPITEDDGTFGELDQRTGALDLGLLPVGETTDLRRRLLLTNKAAAPARYSVDVAFTRGSGSSGDARAAGIRLTPDRDTVTVGAHGKATVRTALHVPDDAPAAYYEGVVTLTPAKGTALHVLRVPFGLRVGKSGFAEIDMTKPVMSTGRASDEGSVGGGAVTFDLRMAGQLRSVDVFLADADGKDLGYIGGVGTVGLTEGVLYGPATVGGWYLPFTGRDDMPLDPRGRWVEDGHYKLRIVGTDGFGHTDTALRDIYVDEHTPSYEDAYGAADPAHPTVVERPADATSFAVAGTLKDSETDAIRAAGLDIGQDDNVLYYSLYSPLAPNGSTRPDAQGRVSTSIALPKGPPTNYVKLWPTDAAGNIGAVRSINLIADDKAYVVGDASTAQARAGDTVTYTLTAHDLKHWKSFSSQIRYDDRNLDVVAVEPTAELAAHDPSAIRSTDVSAGSSSSTTLSFDVGDTDGLTADAMPLVTVTYKVKEGVWAASAGLGTGTTSAVDTAGVKVPLNIQFYGGVRKLNATSSFSARPAAQALLTKGSAFDTARDYSADGIEASLTAPDGTRHTLTADTAARMGADSLAPSGKPYRFTVKVPGHFTWSEDIDLAAHVDGGLAGTVAHSEAALVAGDVNGDDVIDVRDAALVHAARGTADRAADIDHNGTVDARDLAWVVENYLRQNSMTDQVTAPVRKVHGKSLADYVRLM